MGAPGIVLDRFKKALTTPPDFRQWTNPVSPIPPDQALGKVRPEPNMNKPTKGVPLATPTPSAKTVPGGIMFASTFAGTGPKNMKPDPTTTPKPIPPKKGEMKGMADQKIIDSFTKALKDRGIYSKPALAYALATAEHESGLVPKDEYQAGPNDPEWLKKAQASYSGGWPYHGRGYIQLTNDYNYRNAGNDIGVDLLNNPDKANDPDTAAQVLAWYFNRRGTAKAALGKDWKGARRTINADNLGDQIGKRAEEYLLNLQ